MNKNGQSIIEYVLIATLVVLGVVFMGPYVLRSVGAHFKLWDYSVQDSFTENLTQASVNVVPNIALNCNCTTTSTGSCGSSLAGSGCASNEMVYSHTCTPQGCDGAPAYSCQYDTSCCSVYSNIGCGTIPIPEDNNGNLDPSLETNPPPQANNCYYGNEISATQCSTLPVKCTPNTTSTPNTCAPSCLGIVSPGAVPCSGWNSSSLNQSYGVTYAGNGPGTCTNPATPCSYYCNSSASFFINSTSTACSDQYTVAYVQDTHTNSWGTDCGNSNGTCTCPCSTDFSFCATSANAGGPTPTMATVSQTPATGCGNAINGSPPGTPGTTCTIAVTYN